MAKFCNKKVLWICNTNCGTQIMQQNWIPTSTQVLRVGSTTVTPGATLRLSKKEHKTWCCFFCNIFCDNPTPVITSLATRCFAYPASDDSLWIQLTAKWLLFHLKARALHKLNATVLNPRENLDSKTTDVHWNTYRNLITVLRAVGCRPECSFQCRALYRARSSSVLRNLVNYRRK